MVCNMPRLCRLYRESVLIGGHVHHHIMVGSHPKIIEAHKITGILSRTHLPLLVEGESGTGKKLLSLILHEMACPNRPLVVIDCSTILPVLMEKEFFGINASSIPELELLGKGKLLYAAGGTVCLEEISQIPLTFQGRLLRVLQDRNFVPFGGTKAVPLTARIVATAGNDLQRLVREGRFRQDLYFALAASKLTLPPLRERKEDIPRLVNYFTTKFEHEFSRSVSCVTKRAMEVLMDYSWPGNVRELANVLAQAIRVTRSRILKAGHIQQALELESEWNVALDKKSLL